MSDTPKPRMRLLSDDDVLKMLAEIAAHDPRAAALAEEVFRRRRLLPDRGRICWMTRWGRRPGRGEAVA